MTTFEDGPAKNARLMISRTPRFLRVTEDAGKFDALDQIGDTARASEKLYAYQTDGPTGFVHMNMKPRHWSGPICSYRLYAEQPTDAQMRSSREWTKWCESRPEAALH